MLIVMDRTATGEDVERVVAAAERLGLKAHPIPGAQRTAIGITGNKGTIGPGGLREPPGRPRGHPRLAPLQARLARVPPRGHDRLDRRRAGRRDRGSSSWRARAPSRASSRRSRSRRPSRSLGAHLLRGGAYKPRTSPYSFQGLGEEGLKILAEAREATGLPVVTEVLDTSTVDLVARYADCLQIGARNMQNFELLKLAGRSGKPVLLKRGMSATLEEFLLAAEYVLAEGNPNVVLCERGVRTFNDFTRNTLDLAVVPAVERLSHLPILVDPSHGTGRRDKVLPMSLRVRGRRRRRRRDRGPPPAGRGALGRPAGPHAGALRRPHGEAAARRGRRREDAVSARAVLRPRGRPAAGTAARVGAPGTSFGEVVFNTGMAGYQETLTDPSYRGQIVVMTASHIGNYGLNDEDVESDRIQVAGFAARHFPDRFSNARGQGDRRRGAREGGRPGDRRARHARARHAPPERGRDARRDLVGGRLGRGRRGAPREDQGAARDGGRGPRADRVDDEGVRLPDAAGRRRQGAHRGDRLRHQDEHPPDARGPRPQADGLPGDDDVRRRSSRRGSTASSSRTGRATPTRFRGRSRT